MITDSQHSRIPSATLDQRVTVHSTHLHTQLPEIPKNAVVNGNRSPRTSPLVARQQDKGNGKDVKLRLRPESANSSGMDDYDHIEETAKKKSRPRSDYDHVILEGGENRVKLSKDKLLENDYAEVKTANLKTTQPEVTVISISKPSSTSQPSATKSPRTNRTDPLPSVSSIDDPYNRIKGDDPPYNKIREESSFNKFKSEDTPYNKIKDDTIKSDDPYNTVKDDDPYNKVKVDIDMIDDLDPYDAVIEGPNSQRSSSRKKTESFSFKGAISDPYSFVDEERNVSNQTDPYARVVDMDTEIDPYNRVTEDNDSVVTENILPEYGEDDYATVNKVGEVEYAKVNKQSKQNGKVSSSENLVLHHSVQGNQRWEVSNSRDEKFKDEYAKVVKVNRLSGVNGSGGVSGGAQGHSRNGIQGAEGCESAVATRTRETGVVRISVNNPSTPPEPPRSYVDEAGAAGCDVPDDDEGADADHYNTVSLVRENSAASDQSGKVHQQ